MTTTENWKAVEESSWDHLSSLGESWMVKSSASDRGYMVIITDGCGLWGERRSAKYVLDQADEWAPCIEAGIAELSRLVLSEMRKMVSSTWGDERRDLSLRVSSHLHDMAYSWEFHLKRLSDELFKHHWVTPLLVNFHQLETRIASLSSELESKRRQLEELLPDDKNAKNSAKVSSKQKVVPIATSVEAVMSSGPWKVLKEQLVHHPQIMEHLHKLRKLDATEDASSGAHGNGAVNASIKRDTMEINDEEDPEEMEIQKQQERRAKILELTQGTVVQSPQKKKKKKLNI